MSGVVNHQDESELIFKDFAFSGAGDFSFLTFTLPSHPNSHTVSLFSEVTATKAT